MENRRSGSNGNALPVCVVRTNQDELRHMIAAMLYGHFFVDDSDEATPDIVVDDKGDHLELSLTCTEGRTMLERPVSEAVLLNSMLILWESSRKFGFTADPESLCVVLGDRSVKLTPTEFRLFEEIAGRDDDFVSADALSQAVWGKADRNLCTVYISYLRQKLNSTFGDGTLLSSRGKGYKLSVTKQNGQ